MCVCCMCRLERTSYRAVKLSKTTIFSPDPRSIRAARLQNNTSNTSSSQLFSSLYLPLSMSGVQLADSLETIQSTLEIEHTPNTLT